MLQIFLLRQLKMLQIQQIFLINLESIIFRTKDLVHGGILNSINLLVLLLHGQEMKLFQQKLYAAPMNSCAIFNKSQFIYRNVNNQDDDIGVVQQYSDPIISNLHKFSLLEARYGYEIFLSFKSYISHFLKEVGLKLKKLICRLTIQ
ncbi:Hypothetical_protein [Hexamita inflata]|uniref:Hypothetical_protein n=1 Tax=Hexamita inflata TaxID=28002 RepID=A0AA86UNV2_9EUKA|nr:Hypothetical protein HINF_LOCUS49934 [Hexamita inflata]